MCRVSSARRRGPSPIDDGWVVAELVDRAGALDTQSTAPSFGGDSGASRPGRQRLVAVRRKRKCKGMGRVRNLKERYVHSRARGRRGWRATISLNLLFADIWADFGMTNNPIDSSHRSVRLSVESREVESRDREKQGLTTNNRGWLPEAKREHHTPYWRAAFTFLFRWHSITFSLPETRHAR